MSAWTAAAEERNVRRSPSPSSVPGIFYEFVIESPARRGTGATSHTPARLPPRRPSLAEADRLNPPEIPRDGSARRSLIAVLASIAVAAVLVASLGSRLPLDRLGERLEDSGVVGVAAFLLVGTAAAAVGLPRQGLAFVAGLAWGTWSGLALSLAAATGGCALTFGVSRRWLHARVRKRHPAFVSALERLIEHDAFAKIVALRLQPLGTNLITTLGAGITPMPATTFLLASCVGYVPQMLVFALLGAGVRVSSGTRLLASGALLLCSVGVGAWLYRRHVVRRSR